MRKLDASFSLRQEFAQNFRGNALSYPVKYLDEWREWQMRRPVAAPGQHIRVARYGGRKIRDKPRFSRTGVARDHDELLSALTGSVPCLTERFELGLAPQQSNRSLANTQASYEGQMGTSHWNYRRGTRFLKGRRASPCKRPRIEFL